MTHFQLRPMARISEWQQQYDHGLQFDLNSSRKYHKVVSSNTSRLEALAAFFRLLMKVFSILMYCVPLTKS